MADFNANIGVNFDSANAIAAIKQLQSQIAELNRALSQGSAINSAAAKNFQRNLVADINATGKFVARMQQIQSTTEQFTTSLERNKLTMGQYFRYAASTTKAFGSKFTTEFKTIEKVARERVKSLQTQYVALGRDANGALQSIAIRPLKLDLDDLATKQAIAAQKQQIFNQLLKQGSTNLLNFGKNTQWAGRQLMVGFTIPLSIFGTQAGKTFMSLEEQAIKFKRVYGELFTPPGEADEMLASLKELGTELTKYGVALEDTLSLAGDVAAMGKTGSDLLAQVEQSTRLAVLGNVDQQKALEASISITNAFGIAAEDLASKINFLNAVENQTVLSIEDLTTAIPKAGPVVQQLGGSVEDLAFFMTAMKEGGINASEGANALKSGLASIINPTDKAAEMLRGLGINIREIVENNKGDLKTTLIDFAQALDQLDPLERARAIEELFGKFQFARISTLFQNITAEGTQASRVLELTNSSLSDLAQLSEKELGNLSETTTYRFKKAIEGLQIAIAPIGEQFLKAITPIVEFAANLLKRFDEMSDGAKNFVVVLTAVLGGVAPVALMIFGLVANGVANLIKGFAAVRNVFVKTGQDSTVLGSQIEYMTQEQIQAGAVAASLEQSHQRLTQQFTSEKAAIELLIDAYRRAAVAGNALVAVKPIPSTLGGAKGYAEGGIIKGPGTGTSDSILAMLSNGEAVIPADVVARNPQMINQLIAGKLPGFAQGVNLSNYSVRKGSEQGLEKLIQKLLDLGNSVEDVTKTLDNLQKKGSPLSATSVKQASAESGLKVSGTGGKKYNWAHLQEVSEVNPVTGERVSGSLVRSMPASQNAKLKTGQGIAEFESDWYSVTGGLYKTVELGGEKLTDGIRKATDELDDDIGKIVIGLAKDGVVTDRVVAEATKIAIAQAKAKGGDSARVAASLENAANKKVILPATAATQRQVGILQPGETQMQGTKRLLEEGRIYQEGRNFKTNDKGLSTSGTFARLSSSGDFRNPQRIPMVADEKTYLNFGTASAKAFDTGFESQASKFQDPYVEKRDRNSPHRLAEKDGADDAKAYQSGFEKQSKSKSRRVRGSMQGGSLVVENVTPPGATQSGGPRKPRRVTMDPGTPQGDAARAALAAKQAEQAALQKSVADQQAAASVARFSRVTSGAMYALTSLSGVAAMMGGELGQVSTVIFQVSAGMTALNAIMGMFTQQTMASIVASRLKAAQDAAGSMVVGGGIKGLLANIASFGRGLLAFLGGPWGVAIAAGAVAIGALVAGVVALNKQKEEERKKVEALNVAAEGARGKLAEIANIMFGTESETSTRGVIGTSATVEQKKEDLLSQEGALDSYADFIGDLADAANADVQGIIDNMVYTLQSQGVDQIDIEALLEALLEKAGKKDLDIKFNNVTITQSERDIKKNADDIVNRLNAEFASAPRTIETYNPYDESNIPVIEQLSEADVATQVANDNLKDMTELANLVTVGLIGIADQLENNGISAVTAAGKAKSLMGTLSVLPDVMKAEAIPTIAELIFGEDSDQAKLFSNVQDVAGALKLLEMTAMGLNLEGDAAKLFTEAQSPDLVVAAKAQAKLNELYKQFLKDKEQEPIIQEQLNAKEKAQADLGKLEEEVALQEKKFKAYNELAGGAATAAEASEIVSNASLFEAYTAALAADEINKLNDEYDDKENNVTKMLALFRELKSFEIPDLNPGAATANPYQDAMESLKNQNKELVNTAKAYKLLRNAGYDIQTSTKLAADSTLALALATTKPNTKKYKDLLDLIKQIDAASKNNAIKQLVADRAADIQIKSQFLDSYTTLVDMGYAAEDIMSILDNPDLAQSFIKDLKDGKVDSQNLLNYLKQIEQLKKIEVEIALSTPEGKWSEIDKQMGNVRNWFSTQKEAIDIKFRPQIEKQDDVIKKAQEQIEDYNQKIYENEYQLSGISKQEDIINEKYDSRIKSLDAIVKINKVIEAQQKGALSVADALSQGDIAAAARAAQESRVQVAAAQAEQRREQLELAKEKELANIRSADGRTRKDIESQIADYKEKIAAIEHDTVKPAEKIRDAAIATRDAEKDALTYLGLNETAWGDLETATNKARVEAEAYKKAIEDALAMLPGLMGGDFKMPEGYSGQGTDQSPDGSKKTATQKQIDELNRLILITRDRVQNDKYTDEAQKQRLIDINIDRIKEVRKLGGVAASNGGLIPKYFASGGLALGTDTVPAMLTPGEFVMRKYAVDNFGVEKLRAINSGTYTGDSVYNYEVNVNVKSDANPDQIASAVMTKIRAIESQRIRGGRI